LQSSNSQTSKSLAKVFAIDGPELKQISRLSVTILARERKFCLKAALCAKSIGVKSLIGGGIGYTCRADETAAQPTIRRYFNLMQLLNENL
jgi:hypothetical protein